MKLRITESNQCSVRASYQTFPFPGDDDWGRLQSSDLVDYFNYVRYFDEVFADPGDTASGNDDLNDLGVSYSLDSTPSNGNIW